MSSRRRSDESSRSTRPGRKNQSALIEDFLGSETDLVALSRRHFSELGSGSLRKMTDWHRSESTADLLRSLVRLLDDRAALLTARARAAAADRILAIARQETDLDTARRACVDLLKLSISDRPPSPLALNEPGEAPPADEGALRALMDKLGSMGTAED